MTQRNRARAIAIARRRRPDPTPGWVWAALALATLLAVPAARAQTPGGPATLPEVIQPGAPTLPPGAGGDATTTQPRGDSIVPPGGTAQPQG